MAPADIRIGSRWRGTGRHEHCILEIVAITLNSVKVRTIQGASRSQRHKVQTVPTDKFLKTHKPE